MIRSVSELFIESNPTQHRSEYLTHQAVHHPFAFVRFGHRLAGCFNVTKKLVGVIGQDRRDESPVRCRFKLRHAAEGSPRSCEMVRERSLDVGGPYLCGLFPTKCPPRGPAVRPDLATLHR